MCIQNEKIIKIYLKYFNDNNNINVNYMELIFKNRSKCDITMEQNIKLFLEINELNNKINNNLIY